MPNQPAVIIYCDHLLPYSATFVRSQAEALEHFTPYYAGSRFISGLPLPDGRALVINRGGVQGQISEVAYKLWGIAPSFVQQLQQLKPVLLHAHFGPDGVRAMPLSEKLAIPLVVTFHGYDATIKDEYARRSTYSHRVYLQRKTVLQRKARLIVAASEFLKRKLLEQGFPPHKVVVHYIGVDTDQFQPDPTVPREPVVLFVGRLVEKKGCEYLIRAMSLVQQTQPDVELVIIGDGPLRPSLEQQAQATLK
ncbi:MAG: glycosyltransferase, partial [Coleofasciculus sp. S288]|nr:glycosyltransferase [Coleofasciculus sp. S288]